jgi:mono/diheme cytochrome c family protein
MSKKFTFLIVSILIFTSLLVACSGPAPKKQVVVVQQPPAQAPAQAPAGANVPNPGGPGEALNLTGDPTAGAAVFEKCQGCHGQEGKGGKSNPGSDAGTVPALNPANPALKGANDQEFATNMDLFIEHGGKPAGSNPERSMPAFGDRKMLTAQQIADVIAYVMSLNK